MKKQENSLFRNIARTWGLIMLVFTGITAWAQDPQGEGELQDVEVVIEVESENTVPPANRHYEKIPPRPAETIVPPIRYDFQSFSFLAPQINPTIRPLKLKAETSSKIYGGYVRAGYGNFGSPLLEGYITSRKDKNKLVGAHLYHFSSAKGPVDGNNSGSGNTTISVFGRTFSEYVALSGSIDAENRSTHYYGYDQDVEPAPSNKDIRQTYNRFRIAGDIANAKNSDFSYKLGGLFSYLSDKYDARELEFDVNFNSAYKIGDESKINIDAAYVMLSRKDAEIETRGRNLFTVNPSFAFSPVENLKMKIGVGIAYENDTIDAKDLHFYPNVSASYPLSPSVDIFAALTGGMEKVSLQTMSYKNVWLHNSGDSVMLNHASKVFDLNVGINAKLGNKVGVHAGLSAASYRNMHFFVNAPGDQSKFIIDYEDKYFRRTNLYGSLSYAQSEKVKFMLRGDLYTMGRSDDEKDVWHLPKYKLNANASFNIARKFLINLDVIGQGGMKALDQETLETVKLDGALDLNAKVDYLFSDSFSIFAQFNNIAGNEYPLFLNYPVRGFQFLAGLTWSF